MLLYKFIVCLIFAQETADKPERQRAAGSSSKRQRQGFRLTHAPVESEEMQRVKEHENVKVQTLCMFLPYSYTMQQFVIVIFCH